MKRFLLIVMIFCVILVSTACSSQELTIEDVWARPGNQGGNSAVYMVLNNPSDQSDVLLSATSEIAKHVELHISQMKDDGTMTMVQQESVPVPPDSTVEFKPGGLHVMLIDLVNNLVPDDKFTLELDFKNSGKKTIEVTVREP